MAPNSSNPPRTPRPLYEHQLENGGERASQQTESMEVIESLMGKTSKSLGSKPERLRDLLKKPFGPS